MKHQRLYSLAAILLVPATMLGVSCLLPGFDNIDALPDDPDAGDDAGDAAEEPTCGHASVPLRPSSGTSGGAIDFTVAVQSIDLGEAQFDAKTTPPGLDIDGLCTCQGEPRSCVPPPNTTPVEEDYCDYDQGIDNSAAQVFFRFRNLLGADKFGSAFFTQATAQGQWSILFRVAEYNGEADDPSVVVSMYVAGNLSATQPAGPTWDGTDAWPVSSQSLVGGDLNSPVAIDKSAYVNGGVLVASLPESQIDFWREAGAIVRVKLSNGILKAKIAGSAGSYRLEEGVLAARWKGDEFFRAGWELCKNELFYSNLKQRICQTLDTNAGLGGFNEPCDALSFGMVFSSLPAMLGPVYDPPPLLTKCAVDQDPATDSCSLP